jgi:hypothetical protein
MQRPYAPDFSNDLKSYRLVVNIFTYAVLDPYAVGSSEPDPSMPYQAKAPLDPFTDHRYEPGVYIRR